MSRPAESKPPAGRCSSAWRCRKWTCSHCGPIRAGDEFRKFKGNLTAYGGRIMLVAVTAPGADVLPWEGDLVERRAAWAWNRTASRRFARLLEAAQVVGDRHVRRRGWRGQFPRIVARAWAPQKRGVWHVHLALPAESEIERVWSRTVVQFIYAAQRREATLPAAERQTLLELEYRFGIVTRGFYGWGFVDRKAARRLGHVRGELGALRAAKYLAANVARYLGDNVVGGASGQALPGRSVRSHVSVRLTRTTGVTLRNLRRVRFLHVCLRQGLALPEWPDELLEVVWRLLTAGEAVAVRGP